jgi:predicted O-methyltransferase YrrM
MRFGDARNWLIRPRYGIFHILLFAAAVAAIMRWQWFLYSTKVAAVTFQSPLPAVLAVAEPEVAIPDNVAYRRNYDFTTDWFTHHIRVWEAVMAPYKAKPGVKYLEIGAYEGRSAVWMLENVLTDPTAQLTAIDIFDGPYEARYRSNIERSGAKDRVTTIKGSSQVEARKLPLESFDVIYIDGSHEKGDVLEDAALCWRLLKPGGLLIFDDYRWMGLLADGGIDKPTDFPKQAIDCFVQCFADRSTVVHNSFQLMLRKNRQ